MNRRSILKALLVAPFVSLLPKAKAAPTPSKGDMILASAFGHQPNKSGVARYVYTYYNNHLNRRCAPGEISVIDIKVARSNIAFGVTDQ